MSGPEPGSRVPLAHSRAQSLAHLSGMTPMEGRSLLRGGMLLVALSVVRIGVDHVLVPNPGMVEYGTDLPQLIEESQDAREEHARRSAPLTPGETLDPNRSGEEELDRLPGIGPSTARALVADRMEKGGFTRPEDLLRVRGIGPATLAKIRPHLDFLRGVPAELHRPGPGGGETRIGRDRPGARATSHPAETTARPVSRVDLNRAEPTELESLPGIGPALAKRILESRIREGPFRTPEDLLRVRGIGPATLARIRGMVVPGG